MVKTGIRPTAVAGTFYPKDPNILRRMVRGFLDNAKPDRLGEPKGLIVPHAGYVYSGQIAAHGYVNLSPADPGRPRRVFVLAPSHRVYLDGVSVGNYHAYETPLGPVEVDQSVVESLAILPDVSRSPAAHTQDHALEVQLPFLQETLAHFRLVPIMFGDISGGQLADIISRCWQPEDLIVISSDLSHFHPDDKARELDQRSHEAVLSGKPRSIESCEACGRTGMSALLEIARRQQWTPKLVFYGNSGDTAGDKNRVVGYATYLFHPQGQNGPADPVHAPEQPDLPKLVRHHLQQILTGQPGESSLALEKRFPQLNDKGATFITLTKKGQLRGCIGSLLAHRSLAEDLLENSVAATRDPRFQLVTAQELAGLTIEVSILSKPEPLTYADGADLLTRLKPGIHGVILEKDGRRSTFLPQVWDQLPSPALFLSHLCQKAGLGGSCWKEQPQIFTYTVNKIKESA
ncbi:MAG: AmmeMemoRadiSam system protein B [Magnetococcales bacterium]|nr:AmmeMemoRadiSam system protein B [Magnetococcales bacterium]